MENPIDEENPYGVSVQYRVPQQYRIFSARTRPRDLKKVIHVE
jgi:hypothetical protein